MQSQAHPLVSVILPAHNASQTITRALRSVASQTYPHLETIIVDDGSADGTREIVASWKESPVSLHRLERQGGAAAARNHGLSVARGEYVAFLDADDEWLPEKTELQMAVLASDPALSFVTCEAWLIGNDGKTGTLVNPGRERAVGRDAWKTLLHHPCVATPCVIMRRDRALALGGFDTALPIAEDQDFWIRLALAGPVGHVAKELVRVHDRPNSLSKRQARNTAAITLPVVLKHLHENKEKLSAAEAGEIRGARYTALGRNAYVEGAPRTGFILLVKAIVMGHSPFGNLSYLLFSSPPARWLKRLIRRSRIGT